MPNCVIKHCKNNTTTNKKDTGITYHQFPADPVTCDSWAAIVRLSRKETWWRPGKRSVICSAHFNESDLYFTKGGLKRLCKGAVPQNALFLESTQPTDNSSSTNLETELSPPNPVINIIYSVVITDPSTLVSAVENTLVSTVENTLVSAEENTLVSDVENTLVSAVENTIATTSNESPIMDDFPDINYSFDPPTEMEFNNDVQKKTILRLKHAGIMKSLREKTRRLQKANCNLRSMINSLKQKQLIGNE